MAFRSFARQPLAQAVGVAMVALWMAPQVAAQSLNVSDGLTHTASGTYDTGSTPLGHALSAQNAGSRIEGTSVVVRTAGNNAMGMMTFNGGTIDMTGVDVATSGSTAFGVYVDTNGGSVVLRNSTIVTTGSNAGLIAANTTAGSLAISATDTSIRTTGVNAYGATSLDGILALTRGSVTTDAAVALMAASDDGRINATDVAIRANGNDVVQALTAGVITLRGGTVDATSAAGRGLVAQDAGSVINVSNGTRITTIGGTGADVSTGGSITFDGASVQATGAGAAAVGVTDAGSMFQATGASITSAQSTGVRLTNGGSATLIDTTVTGGDNAVSFKSAAGSSALTVSGGSLQSAGSAIIARSGTHSLTVSNGAQLQADDNTLVEVAGGAGLATVFDGVDLVGALTAAPTGVLDLTLRNNAILNGTISNGATTTMDTGSNWTLSGDSDVQSLNLAGTVGFAEPGGGVFKTLTVHGDYAGNGGTLALNTHLAADDAGTDRLVVEGNTRGTTHVQVTNAGGAGMQTNADGIQVVRVDGASDGTFALASRAVGGAYEYSLHQGGIADPNDGDWYLRSALAQETPVDPGTPITPVYRPETGAYLANQAMATAMFVHRHDDRGRLRHEDTLDRNAWVRVTRGQFSATAGAGQVDIGAEHRGLEIGSTLHAWETAMGAVTVGATLNRAEADTRDVSLPTLYRANGEVRGKAAALFGTWVQDASERGGLSVDAWVQRATYEHTVQGEGLVQESYDARAWSASLEGGYAFPIHARDGLALYLQPQLQLINTDYDAKTHVEANGTVVAPHGDGGLTTRLGVRLYGIVKEVQPFAEFNAWHNDTGNAIRFDGQAVDLALDPVMYEGNAGLTVDFGKGWAGWGSLGLQFADATRTYQGQLGMKYRW